MRIWLVLTLLLLAACDSVGASQGPGQPGPPRLIFDTSVAPDLQALADTTWQQFLGTFQARQDCFGDVTLRVRTDMDVRATYDPATATVTVLVPGTPAFLQAALIHEWAHHLEFQCPAHKAMRPAFLAALALPPDTPWRTDHEWSASPSEHYAEAAVVLVLGSHPLPTVIRPTSATVAVLAAWANGQ